MFTQTHELQAHKTIWLKIEYLFQGWTKTRPHYCELLLLQSELFAVLVLYESRRKDANHCNDVFLNPNSRIIFFYIYFWGKSKRICT